MQTPEQCIDPALDKVFQDGYEIIKTASGGTPRKIPDTNLWFITINEFPWDEVAAIFGTPTYRFQTFARAVFKYGIVDRLPIEDSYKHRFTRKAIDENGFYALESLWFTFLQNPLYEKNPPKGAITIEMLNPVVSNTRARLGNNYPFSAHIHDINPLNSEDSQDQTRRITTIRLASEEPESTKKKEHKNLFDLKIDFFREFLPEISDESAKQELKEWDSKLVSTKNIGLGKSFHQPDDEIQDPEISESLRIALMHILVFKADNKDKLDHAIDVMFGRYEAVKLGFYHAVDIFNQCKDYPVSDRLNNLYDIYKAIRRSMERNLLRNPDPVPHFALRVTRGRATHTGRII